MPGEEIYELRLASQEAYGDAYFDDPTAQQSLRFEKHGDLVFDAAGELDLEYPFPSTVGSALFYEGAYQAGESAFISGILRQISEPNVIDVGAYIGRNILTWSQDSPHLRACAFEPVPSNREILERNLKRHGISERVRIESAAAASSNGSSTLYQTGDAAFSSIVKPNQRKIVAEYGVRTLTLDHFLENGKQSKIDLIHIDAPGSADDVVEGARQVIEAHHPCLAIRFTTGDGAVDVERAIARLTAWGYRAFVISDGIVTPFRRHDDRFPAYFFLHASRPLALPKTNLEQARHSIARHAGVLRRERARTARLRESAEQKEAEIRRLKQAADERLDLIEQLEVVVAGERERADAGQLLQMSQLAEGRLRVIETLRAENAELANTCASLEAERDVQLKTIAAAQEQIERLAELEAQPRADIDAIRDELHRKERVLQGLKSTVDDQRDLIDRLQQAAVERLDVIERFDAHVAYLRQQLEYLNAEYEAQVFAVTDRDRQIGELRETLDSVKMDAFSKDLLIGKLDEILKSQRGEADEMRKVAEERLRVIEDLDELARQRLDVIRSLNEKMNAV